MLVVGGGGGDGLGGGANEGRWSSWLGWYGRLAAVPMLGGGTGFFGWCELLGVVRVRRKAGGEVYWNWHSTHT